MQGSAWLRSARAQHRAQKDAPRIGSIVREVEDRQRDAAARSRRDAQRATLGAGTEAQLRLLDRRTGAAESEQFEAITQPDFEQVLQARKFKEAEVRLKKAVAREHRRRFVWNLDDTDAAASQSRMHFVHHRDGIQEVFEHMR